LLSILLIYFSFSYQSSRCPLAGTAESREVRVRWRSEAQ
jgi:hypothetical protein